MIKVDYVLLLLPLTDKRMILVAFETPPPSRSSANDPVVAAKRFITNTCGIHSSFLPKGWKRNITTTTSSIRNQKRRTTPCSLVSRFVREKIVYDCCSI